MISKYRIKQILVLLTATASAVTICLFSTSRVVMANEKTKPVPASNCEISSPNFFAGRSFVSSEKFSEIQIPVTIVYHGSEQSYTVPVDTVGNTLRKLGIKLEANDVLPFDEDELIFENQTIAVSKIEESEAKTELTVPYQTQTVLSDKILEGEKRVIQKGVNGSKTVTYKNQFFNGKLWRSYKTSERVVVPVQDEIIEIGTKQIIELSDEKSSAENKNEKNVLLKTKNDDESFSLPKVSLSAKDKDLLERIVTGEFGSSYIGSCLIAQAIKCAIVYDHYTSIADVITGMGYVGDTDQKSQNAVEAAKFIFDENGLAVKHRLFYMCTEDYYDSEPGNFHSTQNFILQYENVKFFDRW